MNLKEILKDYKLVKMGTTVFISNKYFEFCYTQTKGLIKEEYIGFYRYFGGLQCNYDQNSSEYRILENALCEIAEKILL